MNVVENKTGQVQIRLSMINGKFYWIDLFFNESMEYYISQLVSSDPQSQYDIDKLITITPSHYIPPTTTSAVALTVVCAGSVSTR